MPAGLWIPGLAGLAGGLFVWLLVRPWRRSRRLPDGWPAAWGLVWPWVAAWARPCGRLLSWRMRDRLGSLLLQAGLVRGWQPAHVASLQALSATAAAVAAFWLVVPRSWAQAAAIAGVSLLAATVPWLWLHTRARQMRHRMQRELPFMLDLMTLGVEGGLNLHGALVQAIAHAPPGPLRQAMGQALAAMRAGVPRRDALSGLVQAVRLPSVREWVDSVTQAEDMGMSLAPVLRAQSARQRELRFLQAEQRAQEAPVRLLVPLALCIFPCTFLIIGFPIAMQLGLGG